MPLKSYEKNLEYMFGKITELKDKLASLEEGKPKYEDVKSELFYWLKLYSELKDERDYLIKYGRF